MENPTELAGKRFGEWNVIRLATFSGGQRRCWCQCSCGIIKTVQVGALKNGGSTKCRACARKSHGLSSTPAWRCWINIHQRCYNENHPQYKDYGGRNIGVCESWHVFENFYNDMGQPPQGLSIDRLDNNQGYSKNNCKWSTRQEQSRNTGVAVPTKLYQEIATANCTEVEVGLRYGVSHSTVHNIKKRGA